MCLKCSNVISVVVFKMKENYKLRKERKKQTFCWSFSIVICAKIYLLIFAVTLKNIFLSHFDLSNESSWTISLFFAIILALLIWCSKCLQCIFLLTLPQLISKRGRLFVLASAFFIAYSHPAKNMMRNAEILSDSLSCTQVIRFL